jgi:hypothetical protein
VWLLQLYMPEKCPKVLGIVMFKVVELFPFKPQIQICKLSFNKEYWEIYDDLVISASVGSFKTPISGIDQEGIIFCARRYRYGARGEFVCSYFLKEIKKF